MADLEKSDVAEAMNSVQKRDSNIFGVGSLLAGVLPIASQICAIAYVVIFFSALINNITIPLSPIYAYLLSSLCGFIGGIISIILAVIAFVNKTPRKAFPIIGIVIAIIGIILIIVLSIPIILILFSLGQA
ncbi:MAG: hypothetical protein JNK81_02805 [Anaerolineales bacterium]|nr:hypothetical protein [Anaerolineales bacterium]